MTMLDRSPAPRTPSRSPAPRPPILRGVLAGLLGFAAALLVACGSSGGGLIPAADAGPLQGDFEAVERASESGNGSCSATEAALLKTDQDFGALPSGVDGGLRSTLRQGIANLRARALALCAQPLQAATVTSTQAKTTATTPTTTTTTSTQTTPAQTTSTSTATTPAPGTGGGTAAPGGGTGEPAPGGSGNPGGGTEPGAGRGNGNGSGSAGGNGNGGGQEGGK
jgi:hypothetical protein